MNHEDSIQQRAEMRRGEHPNGTYDAVPLPPLIGTPDAGRDEVIRRFAKARDDIGGDHRAWDVSLVGGEEKVRMSLRAYEGIARIITELREGQK